MRFVRSGELTDDGVVAERSEVFLKPKIHNGIMRGSQLQKNDLLIAIVGATIGKIGVYTHDEPANINQAIAAVRLDTRLINTEYAALFLMISIGQAQLDFLKRPVARANINLEEIGDILIPALPLEKQEKLAEKMQAARESRKQKLAQADELLGGMDEFLFKQLGFTAPIKDRRFVFGVPISSVTSERMDPHFYHPYFVKLLTMIRQVNHKRLGEFVELSHKQWNPQKATGETFNYIEISGVNRNTAEIHPVIVKTIEAPSRARMIVHTGDIIISLTRPHHGSIGIIDGNMDRYIASTGFAIIHKIKDTLVNPIYLWTILRSQICLQQMLQRSSGGNYPAITEDQLLRIIVPIPASKIQDEIVKEHIRRSEDARRLREEAEAEWEAAKNHFEAQLLGKGMSSTEEVNNES